MLLPLFLLLVLAIELLIVPTFKKQVVSELQNSTELLCNTVRTGAKVAIRNHLKALAEQNKAVARYYYELQATGVISAREANSRLRSIFLSQKVGSSGYLYCLNSEGMVTVHPNSGVENENQSSFRFVRDQMLLKEGYIEYDWKNPGEVDVRPKALYMVYFEPYDWIISVSSYRSEFHELINPEDFKENVASLKFGETGYAYIMDTSGVTLIHPELVNYNILEDENVPSDFVKYMIETGKGIIEYQWKNPSDTKPLQKIAVFDKIDELGWLVVASTYTEEIMQPVKYARIIAYGSLLAMIISSFFLSLLLSKKITKPLEDIIHRVDSNTSKNRYDKLPVISNDEIGRLANEINEFIILVENQNNVISREREKYQNLFQTSPDPIFLLKGLTFVDCNPSTSLVFRSEPNDIIGKSILDFSPELQTNGMKSSLYAHQLISECSKTDIISFEWVHIRGNGEAFDAEIKLKPFVGDSNDLYFVAFIRDVTEIRRAEREIKIWNEKLERKVEERTADLNKAMKTIEDANIELKQLNDNVVEEANKLLILNEKLAQSEENLKIANSSKDMFFSIIAHDLKNPIGGMRNLIETLSLYHKKMDADELDKIIKSLSTSSNLTVELLENLLQWAKIQTNRIEFASSYNNILNNINKNIKLTKSQSESKDIRIFIDVPEKLQATYDDNFIDTVLRNLISNAIKFTPKGGKIEIIAIDLANQIQVSIKDSGIGMPKNILHNLFKIESTFSNPGTEGERGTGLGLILCFEFISMLNGKIWAESIEGEGSTFYFTLPKF